MTGRRFPPDKDFTDIKTKFNGQAYCLTAAMPKNLGGLHERFFRWIA